MSHGSSVKAVIYALSANAGIAASKGAAAFFTGSGAMLAEAIHSLADCANQVLLLIGMRDSGRETTKQFPFGYGKVTYFWSMIVALLLFFVGGAFSVMEGLKHYHSNEPLSHPVIAVAVLVVSLILESASLRGALAEVRKVAPGQTLLSWFRRTGNSEMMVVVGEDVAAIGGIVIALSSVAISWVTSDPRWDAIGSVAVGSLLIIVAIAILSELRGMVAGESVTDDIYVAIRTSILSGPDVIDIMELSAVQWGSGIVVGARVSFSHESTKCLISGIAATRSRVLRDTPNITAIHIEPYDC